MASIVYNVFKYNDSIGEFNFLQDDLKVILVNNYSPDIDNHENLEDVTAYEISGVGYSTGGKSLEGKTVTRDNVNDRIVFNASATQWENSYLRATGAIIYNNTSDDKYLVAFIDFGEAKVSNNTSLRIEWNDIEGIFYKK